MPRLGPITRAHPSGVRTSPSPTKRRRLTALASLDPEGRYVYSHLSEGDTIRLLKIEPGIHSESLVGSIVQTKIADAPPYEAISYVWGNPEHVAHITCDGKKLGLTQSLDEALRIVRKMDAPRLVWVDQICINQDDRPERSSQVRFMNQIFRGATKVLVWLGPDSKQTARKAFELMTNIYYLFKKLDEKDYPHWEKHADTSWNLSENDTWSPLRDVFDRAWWRRIWIMGEIGSASQANVLCGESKIDWDIFEFGATKMRKNAQTLHTLLDIRFYRASRLHKCFLADSSNLQTTFIHELNDARTRQATDPRDHLFALLGHHSAPPTAHVSPKIGADYTKATEQVFYDLTIWCLEQNTDLAVLNAVQHCNGSTRAQPRLFDLPSWVCNWNGSGSMYTIGTRPAVRTPDFQAAKGTAPKWKYTTPSNLLSVSGVELDTVCACSASIRPRSFYTTSPPRPHEDITAPLIQSLWTTACGHTDFSSSDAYAAGGKAISAFAQTLLLNDLHQCSSACRSPLTPEQQFSHFAAYLSQTVPVEEISKDIEQAAKEGQGSYFTENAQPVCNNRRFFRTRTGYFGLGPGTLEKDDVVCILLGGITPFILRPQNNCWKLVGECYVHGIMGGEAMESSSGEDVTTRFFDLI